ncbi:hypothetical protein C8R44DRAFT_726707 [Mycena epipterygia]|nr:hypothetical protein C8R44DRAFT_726707 [Mycena epipterygia]
MHDDDEPTILSNLDRRKPQRSFPPVAPLAQSVTKPVHVLPLRQRPSRPLAPELKKQEWTGDIEWENQWQGTWQGLTDSTGSDESLGAVSDDDSSTAERSAADAAEHAKEDLVLARQWEAVVRKCVKSMRESERKDWLREQAEQERFENGSRFGQDSLWEDYLTAGHEYRE